MKRIDLTKLVDEFEEYLNKEGGKYLTPYVYKGNIECDISWGDWKHDHICFDYLTRLFFEKKGIEIERIDEEITDSDGTDCYSATHTIVIKYEKPNVGDIVKGYFNKYGVHNIEGVVDEVSIDSHGLDGTWIGIKVTGGDLKDSTVKGMIEDKEKIMIPIYDLTEIVSRPE